MSHRFSNRPSGRTSAVSAVTAVAVTALVIVLSGCAAGGGAASSSAASSSRESKTANSTAQIPVGVHATVLPHKSARETLTPCDRWALEAVVNWGAPVALADCQGGLVVGSARSMTVHVGERVYFGDRLGKLLTAPLRSDDTSVAKAEKGGSDVVALRAGTADLTLTAGVNCLDKGQQQPAASCVLLKLTVIG